MNPFAPREWPLAHGRSLTLGPRGLLMGIVNVTPDSFSDGGRFDTADKAVEQGVAMARDGAAIIDVGGESTRPGAEEIDGETERARILPVIARSGRCRLLVSVDTYRAETADAALEAGAHIVNDVWGCQREPDIAAVAARHGAGLGRHAYRAGQGGAAGPGRRPDHVSDPFAGDHRCGRCSTAPVSCSTPESVLQRMRRSI